MRQRSRNCYAPKWVELTQLEQTELTKPAVVDTIPRQSVSFSAASIRSSKASHISENPYEVAYPTTEKKESKVPWLALAIMAGAIFICVTGIFTVYRQRQALREAQLVPEAERNQKQQVEDRTD